MKLPSFCLVLLLAGLIIGSCSQIFAQQTDTKAKIVGVINDEFGPISGAIVSLEPTHLTSITNIDGVFSFEAAPGEYVLMVEVVNFGKYRQGITTGADTLFNITLKKEAPTVGGRADPIDIVSAEDIEKSPYTKLSQVLHYLVPGFHSTPQTISDGTDHIDPISYRGLGPDQVLILINGKRWHSSSLVNVNGTFGRGSVSTDINAIPKSAVDHIEILKNGAATRYGSDAVSAVINIVLKEKGYNRISSTGGSTKAGDGSLIQFSANYGFEIGDRGFIHITGDFRDKGGINRSGAYTGTVFGDDRDNDLAEFFQHTGYDNNRVMSIGSAASRDANSIVNAVYPLNGEVEIYAFAAHNYRIGTAAGFYRFPASENRVVPEIYPFGFSPEIRTDIIDNNVTLGVRGNVGGWKLDFSNTTGGNTLDFTIQNSNNASLGINSPTKVSAGGFRLKQNNTNLDLSYGSRPGLPFLDSVNVSFGGVFRHEAYQIVAGQPESYIQGTDTTAGGGLKAAGIQVFPGFKPSDEQFGNRANAAGYIGLELDVTPNFLLRTAARYEAYEEFGDNLSWKASARYLLKWMTVRAAYSTGFRAPSLHQVNFTNESTQFLGDNAVRVGTFNSFDPVTRALGVAQLEPEISRQLTAGISLSPFSNRNLSLNLNVYNINISDRIILSGRFSRTAANGNPTSFAPILESLGVGAAQFFTNSVSTSTQGIDVNLEYKDLEVGDGKLYVRLGWNEAKNKVTEINTPETLAGLEETLFNREEISRLEQAIPQSKILVLARYSLNQLELSLQGTRFGEVGYIHPNDGNQESWVVNTATGSAESRDQLFSSKWITNLEAAFHLTPQRLSSVRVAIGATNILDIYPDPHRHSANISSGRFVYSRRVQQFGVEGAMGYGKISIGF
ncbi:MAG: TonB-dependent receptor [Bacteroidota bacterium]